MAEGRVIALIDGEHHPAAVRDALDRLEAERGVAGVIFCGGEEKVPAAVLESPAGHYGRPVAVPTEADAEWRSTTAWIEAALRRFSGEQDVESVFDLADEPVLPAEGKLRVACLALHLGLEYEAPGATLTPPAYERVEFDGPKLAVIATGKRTGKTAVSGHWARLLSEEGVEPVIVSMGRGGPAEPQVARAGTGLDDLLEIAAGGNHAASDYLEDAVLAGVTAIGCRRVGGGLAGAPFLSNVVEGARMAASLRPDALILEGSGACLPPVAADRTVCIVRAGPGALEGLGAYRLLRSDLALVMGDEAVSAELAEWLPARVTRCELRPEPAEEIDAAARIALFTTGAEAADGIDEPVVRSTNLARRSALAGDLDRAASERCDVYLTELKAAAIDTVAARARDEGARVVFLRNRPVGIDADLDDLLLQLHRYA